MKLEQSLTLKEIASLLNCRAIGNENQLITGINEIHKVTKGDLVFVDYVKYYDMALHSAATTILIDKEVPCPKGKALLVSDNPFRDYNLLTRKFKPFQARKEIISEDVIIGQNTIIQPNVCIGKNVVIGNDTIIHPGVVISDDTIIGNNVIIGANAIIGGDAFYFKKRPEGYDKMHTCGRVVIKDRVEIGMSCTIARGVSGDTIIGEGTKLDGQIHVGHDTVIGKNCLMAAQVGIAGCVTIEDDVTLWGQVGVVANIVIGAGAVVLGQSGLSKSIAGNITYFGSPAGEAKEKFIELVGIRKLPEIIKKLL